MFSSCIPRRIPTPLPIITDFAAAGTLFTNGTHVLAGYQKDYTHPSISGIGGKREGGETYMETALRETVEELFGQVPVPLILLRRMLGLMEPRRVHKNGSYVLVIYNFDDLEKIIKLVKYEGLPSPLYDTFPKSISDLLLDRKFDLDAPLKSEVSHLCLIPVMKNATIDVEFLEDLALVLGATNQSKIEPPPKDI